MTYQKPPTQKHDDNADEASSLLLTVAGGGGGGVPATQKTYGVPRRAMIATTWVLLGTLALIYGGRGRSNSTASSAGISAALLLDQWTVPVVFDPDQDYCFMDTDNPSKYCWFPTYNREPCGNWEEVINPLHGCGTPCTGVYHFDEDPGCSKTSRTDRCMCEPVYDPRYYYCFRDTDNPGKYCWFDASTPPPGNWVGEGGHGIDGCGFECIIT